MQLLRDKIEGVYILWTRWGRIGSDGEYQRTPFGKLEEAAKEYDKVFLQKTGNKWSDVEKFEEMPKKYKLKELDGKAITMKKDTVDFSSKNVGMKILMKPLNFNKAPKSQLCTEFQELFKAMVDTKILDVSYRSVYTKNLKVSITAVDSSSIKRAEKILAEIESKIKELDKMRAKKESSFDEFDKAYKDLYNLSNDYYELLSPTGYAFSKIEPMLQMNQLERQRKQLLDIYDIEVALKIIGGAKLRIKELHPYDYFAKSLNANLQFLKAKDKDYLFVRHCLEQSTSNKDLKKDFIIHSIVKVDKKASPADEEELVFNKIHNHTYLWHGTKESNMLGILAQGLRISPLSSSHTGSAFGDGIYFSDIFDKSFAYSQGNSKTFRVVLLCEVALGNIYNTLASGVYTSNKFVPKNYHSLKVVPGFGPSVFAKTGEDIYTAIGSVEKYNDPYVIEKGVTYYSLEKYEEAHGKKKVIPLSFGYPGDVKIKKLDQNSEDEGEAFDPDEEIKQGTSIKKDDFLAPKFISHELPKNKVVRLDNHNSSNASEYLVFNAAQAKVRYMILMQDINISKKDSDGNVTITKQQPNSI